MVFALAGGRISVMTRFDTSVLAAAVDEAIAANPDIAAKIADGKVAAAGALVGAVMKATKGQADAASVRVTGRWRGASISTVDDPAPKPVKLEAQKGAVEVYLPQVSQYVALQLEG